eukprot:CAMPEP_0180135714 /NCGR_PEP_ID=MMETSP0986-20121125/11011_1 /TAXON_ID=697907 /ORGANISM="non described non described, Strain CCMP2293" /LENGTH=230 /DNA_ID=CAMNT_0022076497 /DNA_START=101 /DNA_END=795 /DNA_ORIENTATION=+
MGGGLSCLHQAGQAPSWRAFPASTTSPGSQPPSPGTGPPPGGERNRLQSPSGCEPLVAAHRNMAGWGNTRGFSVTLARQRLTWAGVSPLGWNALRWCRQASRRVEFPLDPWYLPPGTCHLRGLEGTSARLLGRGAADGCNPRGLGRNRTAPGHGNNPRVREGTRPTVCFLSASEAWGDQGGAPSYVRLACSRVADRGTEHAWEPVQPPLGPTNVPRPRENGLLVNPTPPG